MRIGRRHPWMGEFSLAALVLALAGCSSTSGQNSFTTASLAPRPEEGMRRDAPRPYTAESEAPRPYTQLGYTPPPPEQRAPYYQPYAQQPSPYSRPYPYGRKQLLTATRRRLLPINSLTRSRRAPSPTRNSRCHSSPIRRPLR